MPVSSVTYSTQLERIVRDVTASIRGLRHDLALSLFIVITLGLGVGANAAIFGVADRLLLHGPEQIADANRVVRLYRTDIEDGLPFTSGALDFPAFDALRSSSIFESFAGSSSAISATLGRGIGARHVVAEYVTGSFFSTLGTRPLLGRTLVPSDDSADVGPNAAVISYGLWQQSFGGDHSVLNETILVDDQSYVVVGIAPKGFTGADVNRTDLWMPARIIGARLGSGWKSAWDGPWMFMIGRLAPGVTRAHAGAVTTTLFRHAYAGVDRASAASTMSVASLVEGPTGVWSTEASVAAWLVGLSAIVLLIACANVTNLLLARAARRRREIAIRVALGADRWDVARLFIVEGELLAAASGVAAVLIAAAGGTIIRADLLPSIDWSTPLITVRMLILVLICTVVVGALLGAVSAARVVGPGLLAQLKAGGARSGVRTERLRNTLTMAQGALSVVLLVAAGLFIRSLWSARSIDYGAEPDKVVVLSVEWPRLYGDVDAAARQNELRRRADFLRLAAGQIRSLPIIKSVAVTMGMPFGGASMSYVRAADGPTARAPLKPLPYFYSVGDDYFNTIGTRIVAGRSFDARDRATSEHVAIVEQQLADRLWPSASPLDKCLIIGADTAPCARVVGVAADTRSVRGTPSGRFYLPLSQTPKLGATSLIIRPADRAPGLADALRKTLLTLDGNIDYVDVHRLQDSIENQVRPWRLGAVLFGLLGGLALVIASMGLYGVVSYNTAQRSREIGIRRALGAGPARVVALVVTHSVALAGGGLGVGLAISVVGGRYVRPLLFTPNAVDPVVMVGVVGMLLAVSLIAGLVPAMRANGASAAEVLRSE